MKTILIRWKVYIDRARMYVSYAQTAAVALTALKVFDIIPPLWTIPFIILGFIIVCLFVGWVDMKLGLFQAENKRISEQNPVTIEILKKVTEIENKL